MSFSFPLVRETPSTYSSFPLKGMVYEVSLRVRNSSDNLKDLKQAHHLVQSLLKGELLGLYHLLDFVLWPEGVLLRVSLKEFATLSEFLSFLKLQSLSPNHSSNSLWDDDLEWIRVVPPERLGESTRSFLDKAFLLKKKLQTAKGFNPNLFFFYRDSGL
jgi:hypothetical protein